VRKYVLDTNLYVQAFRNEERAGELRDYYAAFTPSTYLSSVVLHELLVGANTEAKHRAIMETLGLPLRRAGRVITPSHGAWQSSAEALARMARKEKRDLRTVPKSLVNDYLLAASCRESGATLVSENVADFEVVKRYIPFAYMAPWPGA
jgi:predicted nucleic acid-binding protein